MQRTFLSHFAGGRQLLSSGSPRGLGSGLLAIERMVRIVLVGLLAVVVFDWATSLRGVVD